MVGIPKNIKGKIFGSLFVKEMAGVANSGGNRLWLCICSCGKELEVVGSRLRAGRQTSCGHEFIKSDLTEPLKVWSKTVRHRDKKCQACSSTKELQAHHINGKDTVDKLLDIDNGVTLCRDCHLDYHRLFTATSKNFELFMSSIKRKAA